MTDQPAKALSTSGTNSPMKQENSKLQRLLDERMTLSEAIEAATVIVGRYPNGGKNVGKSYIGELAATLGHYPKSVAEACTDRIHGVTAECDFLPTTSRIIAWCERKTEPLRLRFDRNVRIMQQLEERRQFLAMESGKKPARNGRKNIEELKEKYGDWYDNWRSPGTKAREIYETARAKLVSEIGDEAFNALADAE